MKEAYREWFDAFQQYCDSDDIQKESEMNGINACGYGIQCDCCDGDFEQNCCCARAMVEYCEKKNIEIDYSNTTNEYFRKLLLGKTGKEK